MIFATQDEEDEEICAFMMADPGRDEDNDDHDPWRRFNVEKEHYFEIINTIIKTAKTLGIEIHGSLAIYNGKKYTWRKNCKLNTTQHADCTKRRSQHCTARIEWQPDGSEMRFRGGPHSCKDSQELIQKKHAPKGNLVMKDCNVALGKGYRIPKGAKFHNCNFAELGTGEQAEGIHEERRLQSWMIFSLLHSKFQINNFKTTALMELKKRCL